MTAVFADLHDVAQVLSEHIREEIGIVDVQPGAPRDVAATTEASVRITLLYTTPQPSHRNDPLESNPDGTLRFAPLSLSCFYLVTASGADADDPIAAHHALGRIMTLYHDQPELELPLSGHPGSPPGTFTDLGEGQLDVVQVPMMLDQIDKIWMSLEAQLQPWALFEVSPVQLLSLQPDEPAIPVVRPGGLALGLHAGIRPLIERLSPDSVRQGGRVRIETATLTGFEALSADGNTVQAGDASVTVAPDGSSVVLTLDRGGFEMLGPGSYPLNVTARGLVSRSSALVVAPAAAPAVDALTSTLHDPTHDLVLAGANLAGASEAVLWPDVGVTAPTDVHTLSLTAVAGASVTVPSAQLQTAPTGRGPWRISIRVGAVYTPYIVVELGL
jgi:hypothetical protein